MNHSVKISASAPQKKQRRFNFVDFLIIVLILAIIGGVIYLFSPASFLKNMRSVKTGTVIYTIEIKGVHSDFLSKIQENDLVLDASTKVTLGVVTTVDCNTKHTVFEAVNKGDGKYEGEWAEYPDQYDVIVTITADAEYIPNKGYFVNNHRVAIGEQFFLRFPDFTGEGYCISLIREGFQES